LFRSGPGQPADWNRGAYLVRSLGHCGACHSPRNVLGAVAPANEFTGGPLSAGGWYAPSLRAADEAGVADWPLADIVALLQTGRSPQAGTVGPMAEVVFRSTQHVSDADLRAMAVFLKSLPPESAAADSGPKPSPMAVARGRRIYDAHCTQCHGED